MALSVCLSASVRASRRAGPDLEIQTLQEGEVSTDLTDPFRKQ